MPAYDFKCTECAETFEVTRPMNAKDDVCCPSCGAPARKVFSPVGVAFKGTGFHNTDYRPRPKEEGSEATPKTEAPACPAKTEGSSTCAECPAAS
ncbi:MAG: zinc ribbon domain-containing protein [Coriobacteriia bacterium]|nr:zinc ribbon domain-containing protein [Coriobacteriia bacterium]